MASEQELTQLNGWLLGNPTCKKGDGCCPDFSCCTGIISPKETRERFVKAVTENDEKTRMEMLGMFLGEAMQRLGKNVYVAGLEVPETEQ